MKENNRKEETLGDFIIRPILSHEAFFTINNRTMKLSLFSKPFLQKKLHHMISRQTQLLVIKHNYKICSFEVIISVLHKFMPSWSTFTRLFEFNLVMKSC